GLSATLWTRSETARPVGHRPRAQIPVHAYLPDRGVLPMFEKPDITGLSRDEIKALRAEAVAKAKDIDTGDDNITDEALTALETIGEFLVEADAAVEQIDADAAEGTDRLAKARGAVTEDTEAPAEVPA